VILGVLREGGEGDGGVSEGRRVCGEREGAGNGLRGKWPRRSLRRAKGV